MYASPPPHAALLVSQLKMAEEAWNDAHSLVRDVLRQPAVRRMGVELAYRLRFEGALPGDEVEQIYAQCHEEA